MTPKIIDLIYYYSLIRIALITLRYLKTKLHFIDLFSLMVIHL